MNESDGERLAGGVTETGVGGDCDAGAYGAALHACQKAEQWAEVYELLYTMRGEGVTTAETQRPFHVNLWKRAKQELEM